MRRTASAASARAVNAAAAAAVLLRGKESASIAAEGWVVGEVVGCGIESLADGGAEASWGSPFAAPGDWLSSCASACNSVPINGQQQRGNGHP